MNTLEGLPILDHYKNLQSTGQPQDAWAILHEFFHYYGKQAPEEELWYILVMALGNNSDEMDGYQRSTMIFFYEQCKALFSAAFLLYVASPAARNDG